jgi:hypothetical protein
MSFYNFIQHNFFKKRLLAFGKKAFGYYLKLKTSMVNWNETIDK